MMLTQLADVARRTGYPVIEVDGWKTRGHGPQVAVETITCHHTANGGAAGDYPSLRVVRDGRPGLDGPLAQYGIGLSGTIYVIAAGLCWHAGVSLKTAYTNSHAVGIEAEAVGIPGTIGDWPARQMEAYHRLARALVDEFAGVGVSDVRGHKETCSPPGRKDDPDFDMDRFRAAVAAVDLTQPPKELPEMNTADWAKMKDLIRSEVVAVLTEERIVRNQPLDAGDVEGPEYSTAGAISNIEKDVDYARRTLGQILTAVTAPPTPPPPAR